MFIKRAYSILAITIIIMGLVGCSSILDEFKKVNDGLVVANENLKMQNVTLRDSAELFVQDKELLEMLSALSVKQEKYGQFLIGLKLALAKRGGGINEETDHLNEPDNIEAVNYLLLDNHLGDTLYMKMIDLNAEMNSLAVSENAKKDIDVMINSTKGTTSTEWVKKTFHHVPLVAAITILNKFENDERWAEEALLRDLIYHSK